MQRTVSQDTCTSMFIVAVLTLTKLWKQPKFPTTNEWIKNMIHNIYICIYHLVIQKKEIMLFADKWMELEIIMLSEES
jgi:hypothetical protein